MPKNEIVRPIFFMIEVPKEQRKTFFTRPKDKLEYWAFKNRPRAFYNERVVFTFDRKPVAETIVFKVEGPGKGEGEYKHWHKIYWHPSHFRQYHGKVGASQWIGPVFHGSMSGAKKLQGQADGAGMTYFTDIPEYADYFASDFGQYKDKSAVYPSYIRFNKPFDARPISDEKLTLEQYAAALGCEKDDLWKETFGMPAETYFWRFLLLTPKTSKAALMKQGYDGIMLLEALEKDQTPDTTSFLVFSDKQIRSTVADKQPKKLLNLRTGAALKLYHGSKKQFQPGDILTPRSDGYFSDPDTRQHEEIVERNRPEGALPRSNSVYMVADPEEIDRAGGYENYVYEVEPIGNVEKNDLEWYGQISSYEWEGDENPEADKMAQGYWSGLELGGNWTLYEYRAPQAKIVRLVSALKNPDKLASVKTADEVLDVGDGDEYWAGEGNAASGILPVCPQTGNVCLAMRSKYVMTPNCWGTIGGAVQQGKSPQQSAKAELAEETGYTGGMNLIPAYVFTDRGFSYHNFIGVTSTEFPFAPKPMPPEKVQEFKRTMPKEKWYQLITGWETDSLNWVPYETVVKDMQENPEDYHPGMLKLFANSKDAIERALGIKEESNPSKIAAHSPACKCEMCRTIPAWKRPWLTGKCHEFA